MWIRQIEYVLKQQQKQLQNYRRASKNCRQLNESAQHRRDNCIFSERTKWRIRWSN